MVTSQQIAVAPGLRDAWVEVDLDAIRLNLELIKTWVGTRGADGRARLADGPTTKIMGVVKSDAYGHGALEVGEVLAANGCSWLAVASVDEGVELRKRLTQTPILVLSPTPNRALDTAFRHNLDVTITNSKAARMAAEVAAKAGRLGRIHLKIDTGMHRLGCPVDEAAALVSEIRNLASLELISVFSHLAKASDAKSTEMQRQAFDRALRLISDENVVETTKVETTEKEESARKFITHLASSEATRLFPSTHYDMVRVGLYLYGLESKAVSEQLKPAMSVKARINQIIEIDEGESVSYGFTWTAERASRLALIPVGYADGIDRGLSNRMTALCKGRSIPQVGTISMDMMIFDITESPEIKVEDTVTLIGRDGDNTRYLADWATALDTITYELACRLRLRLPRLFVNSTSKQISSNPE
ncbi:MAG TPA: alanine racemase [Oculatellaceae cyanobacterium]